MVVLRCQRDDALLRAARLRQQLRDLLGPLHLPDATTLSMMMMFDNTCSMIMHAPHSSPSGWMHLHTPHTPPHLCSHTIDPDPVCVHSAL